MWGMVRSAALEFDPGILSMVCIDTNTDTTDVDANANLDRDRDHTLILTAAKEASQVLCELVVPYRNITKIWESASVETEICYRGKTRLVRRLCPSSSPRMGDTELVLSERGKLENLRVSSLSGYDDEDEIPHDSVDVSIYAFTMKKKMENVAVEKIKC